MAGHLQLKVEGPNQLMSASFKVKSSQALSDVSLIAKLANLPAFHVQTQSLSEVVYLTWIIEAQERRLIWHSSEASPAYRRHGQYELNIPLRLAQWLL